MTYPTRLLQVDAVTVSALGSGYLLVELLGGLILLTISCGMRYRLHCSIDGFSSYDFLVQIQVVELHTS